MMRTKIICTLSLCVFGMVVSAQNDKKHELGLSVLTYATNSSLAYYAMSWDRFQFVNGMSYKLHHERSAFRSFVGIESNGFEYDDTQSNGIYAAATSNGIIMMAGWQYALGDKRLVLSPLIDVKYQLRNIEGESTGGIVPGRRVFSYNENLIGLAPGFNLAYVITGSFSVQLETNISFLQNYRTGEQVQYGADLSTPIKENLQEIQYRPISILSLNFRF